MKKNFDAVEEKNFLNNLVVDYKDKSPYSEIKKDIIISLIDPYLSGDLESSGLQLGCANGYETEQLSQKLHSLVVLDGASDFVEKLSLSNTHPNVTFILSLFEEFSYSTYGKKFDYIFCNYILEHVYDTAVILSNLKSLLKPGGLLFIVVPNSLALSRQLALQMGLIKDLEELTENDHKHGHRRVYNKDSIIKDVTDAGFVVKSVKGLIFKILADFQLNQLLTSGFLTRSHIEGLQNLAENETNAGFADSIFLVATT